MPIGSSNDNALQNTNLFSCGRLLLAVAPRDDDEVDDGDDAENEENADVAHGREVELVLIDVLGHHVDAEEVHQPVQHHDHDEKCERHHHAQHAVDHVSDRCTLGHGLHQLVDQLERWHLKPNDEAENSNAD